jgi:hypothetical protein
MFGRTSSRRLRAYLGRGTIAAAAGLAVLGAGAWSAPAVSAIQNQPLHLVHVHTAGGAGTVAATNSSCWQSTNWSGYAVSTTAAMGCVPASGASSYTSVSGTWTVPTVTPPSNSGGGGLLGGLIGVGGSDTYSAVWTGIDGFNTGDTNLIQAGTEQDVINGAPQYSAWWEILPAPETAIPSITVKPGDSMTVNIKQVSSGTWSITVTDNGSAGHAAQAPYTTTQSYSGALSSAEWIVEAPTVNGTQSTLANYGSDIFDHGSVNGAPVVLKSGTGGEMVTQSGGILGIGGTTTVISVPSNPDTGTPAGDGFACAYGSNQPAAPSS